MRSTVALSFLLILTILHGLALGQTSDAVSLRLTLGLKDKEPTDWSGRMTVARGRVLRVDAGAPADEQAKPGTWTVRSRRQRQRGAVQPAQVLVTLAAAQQAKVRVETPQGTFSFTLAEVKSGSAIALLDGAVQVERMPFFAAIVTDPTEDDFPACATGADGAVWCTYVSYTHGPPIAMDQVREGSFDSLVPRGNGDQVKLIGFDGESWSAPIDITEPGLDVWRPTVAVDGRGDVWVIWARNIKGNWDIFARRCSSGSQEPGPIKRLTSAAGADTNAVAVTAGSGAGARVAIAWQAWRDGNFDIFVAELRRDGIGRPTRVSSSGANDWHPAIAATSNGDIWVAWDTYDRGNYDVMVRQWANGRLGDPIPVATSLRFEARPSIAVDSQDRLWIAYEDADANWGKDFGTRWPGRMGVPFYLERNVNVRCLAGGRLQAPKAQFRSDLIDTAYDDKTWETEKRQRISLPRLAVGGDGRVWLLCRRHPLTTAAQERWVSFATHYDGDAWAPQTLLPRSHNLLDNRPALVPLPDGRLAVAYSTDGRIAGPRDVRDNNLYAALLSAEGDAKPPVLVPASPAGDDGASPAPIHPAE
ncbi:MAG: TolB family protein, partial [Armatimonadota bacterium]